MFSKSKGLKKINWEKICVIKNTTRSADSKNKTSQSNEIVIRRTLRRITISSLPNITTSLT